jgi:hypothetical protein
LHFLRDQQKAFGLLIDLVPIDIPRLDEMNWPAVAARDFRNPDVKEGNRNSLFMLPDLPGKLSPDVRGTPSDYLSEISLKIDNRCMLRTGALRLKVEPPRCFGPKRGRTRLHLSAGAITICSFIETMWPPAK